MVDRQKIGKQNRQKGQRFELSVRKDLEKKGWILDRWTNNVEFHNDEDVNEFSFTTGKLIPAKSNKFNMRTTGFPDFIAFKKVVPKWMTQDGYSVDATIWGCEVKSNGYLTKEEKAKAKWYLDNNVFSKFLVVMKDPNKKGNILYKEFGK